jgi:hypothetical protein
MNRRSHLGLASHTRTLAGCFPSHASSLGAVEVMICHFTVSIDILQG